MKSQPSIPTHRASRRIAGAEAPAAPLPGKEGKGRIRAGCRSATRADGRPPVATRGLPVADPTICVACDAVYHRKTWRRRATSRAMRERAVLALCPACQQERAGTPYGILSLRGSYLAAHEQELLGRVRHVASRAAYTQPERRLIEVRSSPDGIDLFTTSQKLAHRMAREVKKAFGGDVRYAWSDRDGSLVARWDRDLEGSAA